ncbi:MAG: glycosyltransferase [Deltaproteobacteria bacterium]|nr:glycosyltransferase [Deltaproteobacteria bacterium]
MTAARKRAPYLSVVIPVFNEEENIENLVDRLSTVLRGLGKPFEIIFVDDGSSDASLELLKKAREKMREITVIAFNRNYGQHAAVFAGFEHSSGKIVITLDADLQNPPEEIPKLVSKMEEGYDAVATVRENRQDSLFRRVVSRLINRITARITGVDLKDYGCMLRAYSRSVVESMCASRELSTFIPALATTYAARTAEIEVRHESRHGGTSKYSLTRLIALEFDLLTSFSLWPLRMLMVLGTGICAAGMGFGLFLLIMRLIKGSEWAVGGTFTLFAILFFFVGAQFLAFGLLGEYVGRIYGEVRHRPRFVIKEVYGHRGRAQ